LYLISENTFIENSSNDKYRFFASDIEDSSKLEVDTGYEIQKYIKVPSNSKFIIESVLEGKADNILNDNNTSDNLDELVNQLSFERIDHLAYSCLRSPLSKKAILLFELNVRLYPENLFSYYGLADYYLKTGNDAKALEYFKIALDIIKKYPEVNSKLVNLDSAIKRINDQINMIESE
jgi:tetratricopeptide (TPR) repeat protein